MGEVYRARDTKLHRDVAIKVLLPAIASDQDALARFSREAQVLASLNHPNIAAIYGLEESEGVRAIVMELVEGPTLDDRIRQGASATADAMNSPTITSPAMMTGLGVILGTAAYMSPEQARGSTVDKRADLWAFGVVLYEMLTGTRLFQGPRSPTRSRTS